LACSSSTAALSCGIDALTFGSLMMLASGFWARAPSSAMSSLRRGAGYRCSGKRAMMRPAREMSRVSTGTPAVEAKARMTGSSD